jgi:hypothetical protein
MVKMATTENLHPEPERVAIDSLRPHPRNYRSHPDDQIDHLMQSIQEHGLYRNVVLARDGTILAGHGVVQAARKLGLPEVLAVRLDVEPDSPLALKVLTGDNEIEHLAEQNDRLLSELLKEISQEAPAGLVGTGYDEAMLANLVFVTRPASEIEGVDEARHWAGMPDYDEGETPFQLTISFENEDVRAQFLAQIGASVVNKKTGRVTSIWWPERERYDLASVRVEAA